MVDQPPLPDLPAEQAAVQYAGRGRWWKRVPAWGWVAAVAAALAIVVVAVLVPVLTRPSLPAIAADCGGPLAGIRVDDTGLLIDTSAGTDGLVCVLPKVLSDTSDQYAVTLAVDNGKTGTLSLSGHTVKIGMLGGSQFVFIGS